MNEQVWLDWLQGAVIATGLVQVLKDLIIHATKEKAPRWLWPLVLIVVGLLTGYAFDSTRWLWYGLGYIAIAIVFREVIIELPKALVARVRGGNK